ncbi:MAG: HAD family hydrolase [Pseudomonadota bacterium]
MAIEVISFDLDDTLWPVRPVIYAAIEDMNAVIEAAVPDYSSRMDDATMLALRKARLEREPLLRYDITTMRLRLLEDSLERCGLRGERLQRVARDAFQTFMRGRNRVTFFDGALDTLAELKKTYRLIGLTNGNADYREAGLGELFEFSISPVEAQARKPDSGIFAATLAAADVGAEQILHVGDNLDEDIAGAVAAGWRSVWVNRSGAPPEPERGYVASVCELDELPELIAAL